MRAFTQGMATRVSRGSRTIALLLAPIVTGCAAGTLGISPGTILSTVIANFPKPTEKESRTTSRPTTSARRHIPDSPAPSASALRVLRTGDAYVGVKYVWGGNSPRQGFDCSGFTRYVFAKQGITLPRTSGEQSRAGTGVPADFSALLPGDIMLFAEPGQPISHVAIYAGNGHILHASSSVGAVAYTDLNTGGDWFVAYFVAARRLQ
jgi:cell wall-associated NlpC family hydrolase